MPSESMRDDTYECGYCHGTFVKGLSDEEVAAESQAIWGDSNPEDMDLVCDDCWQIIRPDRTPRSDIREQWEAARQAWEQHTGRKLPPPIMIVQSSSMTDYLRAWIAEDAAALPGPSPV